MGVMMVLVLGAPCRQATARGTRRKVQGAEVRVGPDVSCVEQAELGDVEGDFE